MPIASVVSGQVKKKKIKMIEYKFTQAQFDEISLLLKRRQTESRDEQKKIRAKIRALGFKISDYFNGFSDLDFKRLLDTGIIKIIDKQTSNETQIIKNLAETQRSKSDLQYVQAAKRDKNFNGKDEHYVLDLCDKALGLVAKRQHKFDFLIGDPNSKGIAAKLPVDSFYEELKLVVEYREKQHTESVSFFDKPNRLTVSGVDRGVQRKIYDERRRTVLPKHKILLIEISYSDFEYDNQKRIIRRPDTDIEIIKRKLDRFL
jgi:hypothetical protein